MMEAGGMAMNDERSLLYEHPRAEWFNSLTHGFGWALSIAALVVMVVFAALHGGARHVVGTAIFGSTMVLLYAMSTLYHAGTYTPFCLTVLRGAWGWSLFGIIWGLALLGIVFKSVFGPRYEILSVTIYLAMGWLALVAILPLWRALPPWGMAWLFGGGACYSLGTFFYARERLPFNHAIWHLFVLAGSGCHVVAVMAFVIPWH
jgi:hemolysin III